MRQPPAKNAFRPRSLPLLLFCIITIPGNDWTSRYELFYVLISAFESRLISRKHMTKTVQQQLAKQPAEKKERTKPMRYRDRYLIRSLRLVNGILSMFTPIAVRNLHSSSARSLVDAGCGFSELG